MFFRADLHCHSRCSDGSFSPTGLVQMAVKKGLQGLSITDHDTIEAYEEAMGAAEGASLPLLSGIELSCLWKGKSVHLLGYGFSWRDPRLHALCKTFQQRRRERILAILDELKRHQIDLHSDELLQQLLLSSSQSIGRPHVAEALLRQKAVVSFGEAFQRYLGEQGSCYVPPPANSPEVNIAELHRFGGVAVLAHPHLIRDEALLHELLQLPWDGIEAFYASFPRRDCERWLQIARRRNWEVTGGSDFHGLSKASLPLGASYLSDRSLFESWRERQRENEAKQRTFLETTQEGTP